MAVSGASKSTGTGGASKSYNGGGGSSSKTNNSTKNSGKATYSVKSGDTLSQISKKIGQSVSGIMANNPQIKDANKINVGDKINVSGAKPTSANGYTVKNGDTLSKIAQKHNTTVGNLIRANPKAIAQKDLIYPGQNLNIPNGSKKVDSPAAVESVKPTKATKGVNTQLPAKGVGYTTYYSQDRKFGTAKTIERLQNIAKEWNKRHPNLPIPIGDISKKGGGDISGHASHEKGVDVDMRPFRKDGSGGKVTVNSKNYDAKNTREFVKMVKEMYPKTLIGFQDSALLKSGTTRNWANHDDHLHIRFLD